MRIILIALLTGMLMLACSQGTGSNTPDDAVPAETLATDRSHSSRVFPRGETSLEERIANYPTVVRARMTSESTEVVAGAGRFEGNYYAALKFDLEVGEYLNGTGADNITAIWVAAMNSAPARKPKTRCPTSAPEGIRNGTIGRRFSSCKNCVMLRLFPLMSCRRCRVTTITTCRSVFLNPTGTVTACPANTVSCGCRRPRSLRALPARAGPWGTDRSSSWICRPPQSALQAQVARAHRRVQR